MEKVKKPKFTEKWQIQNVGERHITYTQLEPKIRNLK